MTTQKIARSFKYRLYPTPEQERTLSAWQKACWDVQKWCIRERHEHWLYLKTCAEQEQKPNWVVSWSSQGKEITAMRAAYNDLSFVPADTMSAIVKRVDRAYKKMRKDRKNGIKAVVRPSRLANEIGLAFRGQIERGTVCVSSNETYGYWKLSSASKHLGALKVRMHRPIPEHATVKQVVITHVKAEWYISFSTEYEIDTSHRKITNRAVGIDLNCKHRGQTQDTVAVSDGRTYSQPDVMKRLEKRRQTLERLVSKKRKVRGSALPAQQSSNRTRKRRSQIARIHQTVTRHRDHQQHYIAKRIVESADMVGVEDIDFSKMKKAKQKDGQHYKKNGRKLKRNLNRSLSSAAPGMLRQKIQDKCITSGVLYRRVSAYNTTQCCSSCGEKRTVKIDLSVRTWVCPTCGTRHDRDINAARNVQLRAWASLCIWYALYAQSYIKHSETPVCNGQVARGLSSSDVQGEAERFASTPVNLEAVLSATDECALSYATSMQNIDEHLAYTNQTDSVQTDDDRSLSRNSAGFLHKKRVSRKTGT